MGMIFLLVPGELEKESSCCLGNNIRAGLRLGTLGTYSAPTWVEGKVEPHKGTGQRSCAFS